MVLLCQPGCAFRTLGEAKEPVFTDGKDLKIPSFSEKDGVLSAELGEAGRYDGEGAFCSQSSSVVADWSLL